MITEFFNKYLQWVDKNPVIGNLSLVILLVFSPIILCVIIIMMIIEQLSK
jgi:hypothetical protein